MQRKSFVCEVLTGEESFSALCRKYGITRRTGYKWMERIRTGEGCADQSRAPHSRPRKTPPDMEQLILDARADHPTWGGRKLHRYLENKGHMDLPAPSTIGSILLRNGCIDPDESQKHTPWKRFEHEHPNDLFQMDFKGHFALLDGSRCHPLTITDDCSRKLLCLDAWDNERWDNVKTSLLKVFRTYGLPQSILCDNGRPWGDSHQGYTPFELWMMQMDVLPIHGRPMHPQTQGKDERFHRTLNEDVISRIPIRNSEHAQEVFDHYRCVYNEERPHAALNLDVPDSHYHPSSRKMPEVLTEPEYRNEKSLRKVNYKGYVSIDKHRYYLSEVFIGKYLSCEYIDNDVVALFYGDFQIAKIDLSEQMFISRKIYRRSNL